MTSRYRLCASRWADCAGSVPHSEKFHDQFLIKTRSPRLTLGGDREDLETTAKKTAGFLHYRDPDRKVSTVTMAAAWYYAARMLHVRLSKARELLCARVLVLPVECCRSAFSASFS